MNPPEFAKKKQFNSKSYTWNLGIILFELFYYEILRKNKGSSFNFLKSYLSEFSFPQNEKYTIYYFLKSN